jgi:restriction endonuclease S subunit
LSWPLVCLEDVCSKISDGTHQAPNWATSGVPFLFVSNIRNGSISFDTNKFVSNDEYRRLTKHNPIEAGDVLYTAVGSYGNSAVVPCGKTFVFQRHIAHIKPNHDLLDAIYLSQMLETPSVRRQADRVARGVAQKTVTLSSLRKFQIHLPPLDEQRRIATILGKADALRRKRKNALEMLDGLVRSIFFDLSSNYSARTARIAEFADVRGGKRLPKGHDYCEEETGYKYLRVIDIQKENLRRSDLKNPTKQFPAIPFVGVT